MLKVFQTSVENHKNISFNVFKARESFYPFLLMRLALTSNELNCTAGVLGF